MKIIHTSDWHLGHTLYNYDRREEQALMLRQIADAAEQEAADALVVSGDLFHTAQPSNAVDRQFVEGLMELRRRVPGMAVVVTAGNHDSASRVEVYRSVWEELGVTVIGQLDRDNPASHIVELPGKGWIAAVPYCSDRNLPEQFFQELMEEVGRRNAGQELPVVLMAHATVSGSDFSGHEDVRELTVGGIDSMELDRFGEGYDYLALGHIHKPQYVAGSHGRARYSGTPLAVSFDETYPHSLTVVELAAHGDEPEVRELPLEPMRPLVTLPSQGAAPWEEALGMLDSLPADLDAYVRLNVRVDGALSAQAHQEALRAAEGKECRFCVINAVRDERRGEGSHRMMTVSELRAMSPLELAESYAGAVGVEFDDDMRRMFREVTDGLAADR